MGPPSPAQGSGAEVMGPRSTAFTSFSAGCTCSWGHERGRGPATSAVLPSCGMWPLREEDRLCLFPPWTGPLGT